MLRQQEQSLCWGGTQLLVANPWSFENNLEDSWNLRTASTIVSDANSEDDYKKGNALWTMFVLTKAKRDSHDLLIQSGLLPVLFSNLKSRYYFIRYMCLNIIRNITQADTYCYAMLVQGYSRQMGHIMHGEIVNKEWDNVFLGMRSFMNMIVNTNNTIERQMMKIKLLELCEEAFDRAEMDYHFDITKSAFDKAEMLQLFTTIAGITRYICSDGNAVFVKKSLELALKLGAISNVNVWQDIIGCIGDHLWIYTHEEAQTFAHKLGLYYNVFMDITLRTQVMNGLMQIVELIPGGDDINNYISTSLFRHLLYTNPEGIAQQNWMSRVARKECILALSQTITMCIKKGITLPQGDRCVILAAQLLGFKNNDIINGGVNLLKSYLANISYFKKQNWLQRGLVQSCAEWTDHDTTGAFEKLLYFVIFEM